jgi:hypothetical protein
MKESGGGALPMSMNIDYSTNIINVSADLALSN